MLDITNLMIIYLIGFAAVHSALASLRAKRWARRRFGAIVDPWYMMFFSVSAAVTLLPLLVMVAQNPGGVIYMVPGPWFYLMLLLQAAAGIASLRAFIDAPHRFLIRAQLGDPLGGKQLPIAIKGIYCYIRDPFLLSGLLLLWLTPFITENMLPLYIIASVYLFMGSMHWESRLIAQFGEAYKRYQQEVPRMIPWKGRKC